MRKDRGGKEGMLHEESNINIHLVSSAGGEVEDPPNPLRFRLDFLLLIFSRSCSISVLLVKEFHVSKSQQSRRGEEEKEIEKEIEKEKGTEKEK